MNYFHFRFSFFAFVALQLQLASIFNKLHTHAHFLVAHVVVVVVIAAALLLLLLLLLLLHKYFVQADLVANIFRGLGLGYKKQLSHSIRTTE